ncbi:hypothetical protein SISNIDRAFT_416893 [Sistotremastrum niveocremeum HHB9708]|uniref:Oxidoreductase AflY n=1 Tax=Sistotremastrum niveocremeum HHB9708 TaxID=1314777 RepID=A0A164QCW5_9AGAM|nr:hypothetical protein SISNIDRAFT_416893 [Sistotremastrum niveocremeum HHB9708]
MAHSLLQPPTAVRIHEGLLNIPSPTPISSKAEAERGLTHDHFFNHCFFTPVGLHNHLSHHILAAYDLGAPTTLLKAIAETEQSDQRDIHLKGEDLKGKQVPEEGSITEDNWKDWLGKQEAYSALLSFFRSQVVNLGREKTLERFVFSDEANDNGTSMVIRLVSGAAHPLIQLGYGAEFSDDLIFASGLAQAAVHNTVAQTVPIHEYIPPDGASGGKDVTLLHVLRAIYDNPLLEPVMPYDPDALLSARRDKAFKPPSPRVYELAKTLSLWSFSSNPTNDDIDRKVEEAVWTAILLFIGSSKKNRKPRLDFFLMHAVTSSLFLGSVLRYVQTPAHKVALLRAWAAFVGQTLIMRGRPRVDGEVAMSFSAFPTPPSFDKLHSNSQNTERIVTPSAETQNAWLPIIQSALHANDSHTVKTIRTLLYAAKKYGQTPAGSVPGAFVDSTTSSSKGSTNGDHPSATKSETHPGLSLVDGTLFIRTAGVVLDIMGWVDHEGQKEGEWDRSALGWDAAWERAGDGEGERERKRTFFNAIGVRS